MTDASDQSTAAELKRIADALERAFPAPASHPALDSHAAWRLEEHGLVAVPAFRPLPIDLIVGVDRQRGEIVENLRRHGSGRAAHDMLLWGVRGTGKSALVKSAVGQLRNEEGLPLILIEVAGHHVERLPALWSELAASEQRICLYIDDIGYDGAGGEARRVRSMLDGGVEARPQNVRLAVTSNQRNILERKGDEQTGSLNERDTQEDALALADRFGMKLGFQRPSQQDYLAMVDAYARYFGLDWQEQEALAFSHQRGGRSGRTAWHFIVELAGSAGKPLDY